MLKLGEDHYACWDPDLLRIAAFWKNGFVEMSGMAAHSYPPERAKQKAAQGTSTLPKILGTPIFTNGMYPGWSSGITPKLKDPDLRRPTHVKQALVHYLQILLAGMESIEQLLESHSVTRSRVYQFWKTFG